MGNLSVVADPRRCVSCKSCMAACTAKHSVGEDLAIPRLKVVQISRSSTAPVLCHHCEDAPCVKACPAGALYRDEENARVGVDMAKCIGCRSCVAACPFGAVDVVASKSVGHGKPELFETRACVVKCDRCVDREGGPACMSACGFSALRVVERDEDGAIVRVVETSPAAASLLKPSL